MFPTEDDDCTSFHSTATYNSHASDLDGEVEATFDHGGNGWFYAIRRWSHPMQSVLFTKRQTFFDFIVWCGQHHPRFDDNMEPVVFGTDDDNVRIRQSWSNDVSGWDLMLGEGAARPPPRFRILEMWWTRTAPASGAARRMQETVVLSDCVRVAAEEMRCEESCRFMSDVHAKWEDWERRRVVRGVALTAQELNNVQL
jgi:hypothetical protein